MLIRKLIASALIVFTATASAFAGSLRIDLPQLVGDYTFSPTANSAPFDTTRAVTIPTQYGFYSISTATVVVDGTVSPGRARGDGVVREATEFDLVPYASAGLNAYQSVELAVPDLNVGAFHIEKEYKAPYVPATTPLPNPDGYPPIQIVVGASIGLNDFYTNYAPFLGPPPYLDARDGFTVVQPITAKITNAYLILDGPGVVPEPSQVSLILVTVVAIFGSRRFDSIIDRRFCACGTWTPLRIQ